MSASVTTRAVMIAVTRAACWADTASAARHAPTARPDPATAPESPSTSDTPGHNGRPRATRPRRRACRPPAPP
jgi:hypothetical protein